MSHQKVDLHNKYLVLGNDILTKGRNNPLKLTFRQAFVENIIVKQMYGKNMEIRFPIGGCSII